MSSLPPQSQRPNRQQRPSDDERHPAHRHWVNEGSPSGRQPSVKQAGKQDDADQHRPPGPIEPSAPVVQAQHANQNQTDGVVHLVLDRRVERRKLLRRKLRFEGMSTDGPQAHGQGGENGTESNERA